jgi:hypothetical protein
MSRSCAGEKLPDLIVLPPSSAGGPAFLRCGGASPPAPTRSMKTHVAHRRIKIERVYRPYLTASHEAFTTVPPCSKALSHSHTCKHTQESQYVCHVHGTPVHIQGRRGWCDSNTKPLTIVC